MFSNILRVQIISLEFVIIIIVVFQRLEIHRTFARGKLGSRLLPAPVGIAKNSQTYSSQHSDDNSRYGTSAQR